MKTFDKGIRGCIKKLGRIKYSFCEQMRKIYIIEFLKCLVWMFTQS